MGRRLATAMGRSAQIGRSDLWIIAIVVILFASFTACSEDLDNSESAEPAPTVTETETVTREVTPDSCIETLDLMFDVLDVGADASTVTQGYISLIPQAYEAGLLGDQNPTHIYDEMTRLTKETTSLSRRLGEINKTLGPAARKCRGS